ncbi:hypothetical protein QQ045_020794 [Rhodiola kirilowii]
MEIFQRPMMEAGEISVQDDEITKAVGENPKKMKGKANVPAVEEEGAIVDANQETDPATCTEKKDVVEDMPAEEIDAQETA